jgi:ribonuclease Z
MQIVTLGTGSPLPDPDRAGPATLVRTAGLNLLFDCGRGVLMRAAAMGVGPGALSVVFLTHLHSDHVTDLNDVITMQWAMSFAPTPLRIIGPVGTADFVDRTLAMLREDISYRIAHHDDLHWQPMVEVTEVTDGVVFEQDGVRVIAQPTDHRPVHPTVGYRVEADERVAVIAGDTNPCEGLDLLCVDADLYLQTTIRRAGVEAIPLPRLLDILDYHSSIEEAAETATRNHVRMLVMTHPVPAPPAGSEAEAEWVSDAMAAGFTGEVALARDLQVFEV